MCCSAIDNATRGLLGLDPPQVSVLCGLWFSLGHSTIVIVVNIAIAVSLDIYDKLDKVGTIGGIVGASVSASFLFIIGVANSIILYGIIRRRRLRRYNGDTAHDDEHASTLTMRIVGPVTRFVNRPWKMYPVGVLFGFGFDTASSIALLAITGVAQQKVSQTAIAVLPFLFTAGMSLVDSVDSVLMVYAYAGFPEGPNKWRILHSPPKAREEERVISIRAQSSAAQTVVPDEGRQDIEPAVIVALEDPDSKDSKVGDDDADDADQSPEAAITRVKRNSMSDLSIVLTLMSILVAFSISLITIMGLIGDNCAKCRDAAESDPGLAGKWWRAWAKANDKSGIIGACIVGAFLLVVISWYTLRYLYRRRRLQVTV